MSKVLCFEGSHGFAWQPIPVSPSRTLTRDFLYVLPFGWQGDVEHAFAWNLLVVADFLVFAIADHRDAHNPRVFIGNAESAVAVFSGTVNYPPPMVVVGVHASLVDVPS
jgi:hypothetical protein